MTDSSNLIPRRNLLHSFGAAAAGLAFVDAAVAQENKPGAQVEDRASSIRLTGMKTYWVGPVVYLKLETNHGIVGWGDIKGVDPRVSRVLAGQSSVKSLKIRRSASQKPSRPSRRFCVCREYSL
jgi:hypothetical protein